MIVAERTNSRNTTSVAQHLDRAHAALLAAADAQIADARWREQREFAGRILELARWAERYANSAPAVAA